MSFRTTAILALVALVLAGVILAYALHTRPLPRPAAPEVWAVNEGDIVRLRVRLASGETSAFIKKETGWVFDDGKDSPIDFDRWGGIVLLVTSPQSKRLIATGVEDASAFGLSRPSATITLGLKNEMPPLTVHLGDPTPDLGSYYVRAAQDTNIYTVDAVWRDVIIRLAQDPPYIHDETPSQGGER